MKKKTIAFIVSVSMIIGAVLVCFLCNVRNKDVLDINVEALTEQEAFTYPIWHVTYKSNYETGEYNVDCDLGDRFPCPKSI